MILLDKFYTLNSLKEDNNLLEAVISIDSNHAIFKGHFPGNPVTPGVVQMEIVKELVSTYLKREVSLKTMGNCKFLAILNPQESSNIMVQLNLTSTENNSIKVSGQLANDSTVFMKIQAEYC
jgi:3-hydroxyacyl-[acyl-carrier-protein] dehydratase